eukprot:NODE_459_length_8196_cov_0.388539.p4 type:complete len:145 gc:universal NODE_459_length_8196_cov_0.388539:3930-3496(-)
MCACYEKQQCYSKCEIIIFLICFSMCGIFLSTSGTDDLDCELLKNRGPDYSSTVIDGAMTRFSSILALRGFEKQPFGNLQFNGEIYVDIESDTRYAHKVLSTHPISEALSIIDDLDAEFALTWVDENKRAQLLFNFVILKWNRR